MREVSTINISLPQYKLSSSTPNIDNSYTKTPYPVINSEANCVCETEWTLINLSKNDCNKVLAPDNMTS